MSVSTRIQPEAAADSLNKTAVWTFSAAHLMNDLMTTGIVPALLPLYKLTFHLSYGQTGLIVLVSYLTSSVMQPIFGAYTDKRPSVWLLPLGVFLSCFGLALTGAAPSFPWLLIFIALSGLGSGAFHPEASRGTQLGAGKRKGLAQAIFQVGGNGGQALGPLMLPLFLLATGYHGLLWFLLLAVLAFGLTWRVLPWYRERVLAERVKKKQLEGENQIGGMSLLVIFIILRSWCQIGVAAFLPFFFGQRMPIGEAELFDFLFLVAGAIGTFFGGTLSDKLGRKRLLVLSMIFSIPSALLLPHVSGIGAIIVLFLFGFTVLSSFAVTVVYGQSLLPRNIALASGLTIGFGVGAGGIGAQLLGWLSDHYGVSVVFDVLSVIPILAAIVTCFLPGDNKLGRMVRLAK